MGHTAQMDSSTNLGNITLVHNLPANMVGKAQFALSSILPCPACCPSHMHGGHGHYLLQSSQLIQEMRANSSKLLPSKGGAIQPEGNNHPQQRMAGHEQCSFLEEAIKTANVHAAT